MASPKLGITFLQAELIRVSEWIKFADQKAWLLAIYYALIIGWVLSKKNEIYLVFTRGIYYQIFMFLLLVEFLILWIVFLFLAVVPILKNKSTVSSVFFYWTVANYSLSNFQQELLKRKEVQAKNEIAEQIYSNSVIAKMKMQNIKHCTSLFFLSSLVSIIVYLTVKL